MIPFRHFRAAEGTIVTTRPTLLQEKGMVKTMYERYTERARRIVTLASDEAHKFRHGYIGTEHLLLGLMSEGESMAAQAIARFGLTYDAICETVDEIIGYGATLPTGHRHCTPRCKKVLEDLALRESLQLGHSHIGPEHLLLGILREGEGVAVQIIVKLGLDGSRLRRELLNIMARDSTISPPVDIGINLYVDGEPYSVAASLGSVLRAAASMEPRGVITRDDLMEALSA